MCIRDRFRGAGPHHTGLGAAGLGIAGSCSAGLDSTGPRHIGRDPRDPVARQAGVGALASRMFTPPHGQDIGEQRSTVPAHPTGASVRAPMTGNCQRMGSGPVFLIGVITITDRTCRSIRDVDGRDMAILVIQPEGHGVSTTADGQTLRGRL